MLAPSHFNIHSEILPAYNKLQWFDLANIPFSAFLSQFFKECKSEIYLEINE